MNDKSESMEDPSDTARNLADSFPRAGARVRGLRRDRDKGKRVSFDVTATRAVTRRVDVRT